MMASTEVFLKGFKEYLKRRFTEESQKRGVEDVVNWTLGYTAAGALQEYPACIAYVSRKELSDSYSTKFTIVLGLAVSGSDPATVDHDGSVWTDIIEDVLRSDWHLGGIALDLEMPIDIETDVLDAVYLIQATLVAEIDIGGFVYEDKAGEGEMLQEMRISDEGSESGFVSALQDGPDNSQGE